MRTQHDISDYSGRLEKRVKNKERLVFCRVAYEACIPQDFWNVKEKDVALNKKIFKTVVKQYVKNLTLSLNKGYGLLITGNNGSGKTMFLSYILKQAILKNRFVYYTTAPKLENDLKKGWSNSEYAFRLERMMSSDFVAIDELGKEAEEKTKDNYMTSQAERFFKQRFDDGFPTLLASNRSLQELFDIYGESFASIIDGRYKVVGLASEDFRKQLGIKMNEEMGY